MDESVLGQTHPSGSLALGAILREARETAGYTQSELARLTKLHQTTISKIERGERGISVAALASLGLCLGPSFTWKILTEIESSASVTSAA